jgi:hypothetical protein
MEGLVDEFWDDPKEAIRWLEAEGCSLVGLNEEQIVQLFVDKSMDMMPDGPQ